jgi:hypothetical protein
VKELTKTVMNKTSKLPPTMGSMEFKLAVIRKQQLKKEIKIGHNDLKGKKIRLSRQPQPSQS